MSNIAKGYKQTEAGVIPEDFEVRSWRNTIKVGAALHQQCGGGLQQRPFKSNVRTHFIMMTFRTTLFTKLSGYRNLG